MASVPKIHQGFGRIFEWDNKKGHLDKWWFYKNDKFGKNLFKVWQKLKQDDKRGMSHATCVVGFTKMTYFAKRTGKFGKDRDNETTKQSYQQLPIFTKMANLGKWGIEQESTHDLVKPQMRWQRGEYWQKTNFDKYGECAKHSSRIWPNIQMRW